MTKMQKLVLLMTFWFAPGGDIKAMMWDDFTGGKPMDEDTFFLTIAFVINGVDETYLNWFVFDGFIDEMNKKNGIIMDQVATPVGAEQAEMEGDPLPNVAAPKAPRKRKPKAKETINGK